jgi:anaerobic magnesium-protoporphyrin IX monomethyl ester cyclase
MARVLLINPPSPERLGAPLLGQQYVAASLLAAGHEVKVIDAAARCHHPSPDEIIAAVDAFRPHLTGMGLFTRWVWHAYRLARALRGRAGLLVAGGAHPTVLPNEPLEHGFDLAVAGEAEDTILALAEAAESGRPVVVPPPRFIDNLDRLAPPHLAQPLYDSRWYDPSGRECIPGGLLTSRGCPARCTFCANYVTGRGFRFRSAASVVDELNAYHRLTGATFFPFWDDALTANTPRLFELCQQFETGIRFPLAWSAITRANMVTPELLRAMKRAGCVSVNFGVESGDNEILRVIKKGVSTQHVVRALEWAKAEGLLTACNFMLGFPQEKPAALENTLCFMQRIAPLVDSFSTLGVVVPFPGTPLYDDFHAQFGFTNWWLKAEYSRYVPCPSPEDFDRFRRHYIDDANLELDFFRYTPEMRRLIRECLLFKAEHNLRHIFAA